MGIKGTREPLLPGSYKTTSTGVTTAILVALMIVADVIKRFPEGGGLRDIVLLVEDHKDIIVLALGNLGLGIWSRDDSVTSEKAGAK